MSIDNSVLNNRALLDSASAEINQNDVQYMNNTNTLMNRMDSGSLLDVATAASLFLPDGPESLPPPDQYPPEEILSAQDLTEEDRKLAAALVAVQLVQQQKQQQLLLNDAAMSSVNNHSSTEVLPEIVNLEKMALGRAITNSQPLDLPSIEKSLSTNFMNNSDSHISNQQQLDLGTEQSLLTQPTQKRSSHWSGSKSRNNLKRENNKLSTKPPLRFAALSSICSSFSESIDIKIEDELDEADDGDSDYDVKTETRSSKKSLPHKKRISRKLRHNPKNVNSHSKFYKCNSCSEQFMSQAEYSAHKAMHNASNSTNKLSNVPFSCQLCPQRFDSQLQFFEHLKGHYEPLVQLNEFQKSQNRIQIQNVKALNSSEKESSLIASPLKCSDCGRTFKRQKAYEAHVRDAHSKLNEIEEFSEPEDLMEGIRFKVVVDSEDCDNDNDVILSNHPIASGTENQNLEEKHSSSNQLLPNSHIEIHSYSKVWYREDELHATEADLRELEAQQFKESQINSSVNSCHLCGAVFEQRSYLTQHLTQCYLGIKQETEFLNSSSNAIQQPETTETIKLDDIEDPKSKKYQKKGSQLVCTICGRLFNHRNSLVYHLRSHSGERPHKCDECGKSFFASSALKVHLRLHSGDKPFKCEYCGRHFRQWGDLKYHSISIHSDQRQYQCEYCGKDFARKYSLILHRRIHTGEKNYQCEYCNKTFRASSYLQNHRKIHTGEKPHPCDICGKPFRVRSDMKRHMNTHNKYREPKSPEPKLSPVPGEMQENNSKPDISISEFSDINQLTTESATTELNKVESNMKTEMQDVLQTPKEEDNNGALYAIQSDPLAIREGNNTLYVWPVYMN